MAAILQGRAAGADAVGPEHLAGARPHRASTAWRRTGTTGSSRRKTSRSRSRSRRLVDDRDERRAGGRRRRRASPQSRGPRSPSRRSSSLAVGGLSLSARRPQGADAAAGGVKRVAVLPFENLGAPEDDYFADGIADEIRGKLTSLPGFEVIARGSSTPYKKTTKTPQADRRGAGRALPADRDRAVGEGRRREPRPRQPRARRRDAHPDAPTSSGSSRSTRRSRTSSRCSRTSRRRWRRRWAARSGRARRSGSPRSPRRISPPTTPS